MKKILIVDDDPTLAELVAEFCREAGFEAHALTDSRRAVETARGWRPDLITLDLEMPGLDGIEVLRALQADPDTARIPVIIVSVVAKGALDAGLLKGARLAFEKPLKFHNLVDRLQKVLENSAADHPVDKPAFEPYVTPFA
jgi:CheY-like chemotaxis protein